MLFAYELGAYGSGYPMAEPDLKMVLKRGWEFAVAANLVFANAVRDVLRYKLVYVSLVKLSLLYFRVFWC